MCDNPFWDKTNTSSGVIRETRTEEDFVENIDGLINTAPDAPWRFVTDNLNTHVSETLVFYYTADACGIETDLGVKGCRGILNSVETRRAFLADKSLRIHIIYTTKRSSWLNQIEIWFGTLRRKLTRYGSFCPIDDLSARINRFIDHYNETMAKPYRWTCDGTLLCK